MTVLEWLNSRPGFAGRVAAFGSWDVLPSILNVERSGIPVGTGWQPVPRPATDRDRAINQLAADLPRYWDYGPFDAPIVYAALESMRTQQPRVLYVMLGEGDEWAHEGRYDLYLDATQRADRFIQRIWETAQSMRRLCRTARRCPDHRPWAGRQHEGLVGPRPRRAGGRTDLDCGDGTGVPALGVRKDVRGDHLADRRDDRRARG